MIKRYCDRCGQQIDEGVHAWYVLELNGTDGEFRHKELCEECYAYLFEDEPLTCDGNCWMKKQNGEWLCEHCQRKPQTEPTISKMEQVDEPQTEPLPKTINGVRIADAVAWADKWLEDNSVSEMWDMIRTLRDATEWQDEPQTVRSNLEPFRVDEPQTERSE